MIGFLHTAEVHTATFTELLEELAPGTESTHVVDESLLADAQARGGVDPELETRLAARLRALAATATVVVCTCSTISGAAEGVGDEIGVPMFRAGDLDGYLDEVARSVDVIAVPVDVIVLAQASMAGAADRAAVAVPVLSSPRFAVEAAVSANRAATG